MKLLQDAMIPQPAKGEFLTIAKYFN